VDAPGQAAQYYLAGAKRLIPVSELQAQIQQAAGRKLRSLTPAAATAAPKESAPATETVTPPTKVPEFVRPQQSRTVACAAYHDRSFSPKVLVDSVIPAGGGVKTTGITAVGAALADQIWLPPGRAALVQALPSPRAKDGPVYLVTDVGRRYAIPSTDVLQALGLSGAPTSRLPSSLLVRIPEGPPLDPVLARRALDQERADP
jgi:ESX secretion system ATPase EccB